MAPLQKMKKKFQNNLDFFLKICYNIPVMSKKTKTLVMYEDPGHGWCKVSRNDKIFQMIAKEVTNFSHQRGDSVYLEEDYDLGLYYKKLEELGYEIKWKYNHTDNLSRIRNYEPYSYSEVSPVAKVKKQYDITKSSAVVYIISRNEYAIGYSYSPKGITRVMNALDKKYYKQRDKSSGIRTLSQSFNLNKPSTWNVWDLNEEARERVKKEIQAHVEKTFCCIG